jgi:hypothetical protein
MPEISKMSAETPCIFQLPTTYFRRAILHPFLRAVAPSGGESLWEATLDGLESRT